MGGPKWPPIPPSARRAPSESWRSSVSPQTSASGRFESQVLERRGVGERRDQLQSGLLEARAVGADEAVLPDRREDDVVGEDALDLVQHLLAPLAIHLLQLPGEPRLDVRQAAVGAGAAARRVRFEARGRVAGGAGGADEEVADLLLAPRRQQRRALHRADAELDADSGEIVHDRLTHPGVGRERREVTTVEAVGMAGLGQQRLGATRIVRRWVDREGELLVARHDVARRTREAERLRLV